LLIKLIEKRVRNRLWKVRTGEGRTRGRRGSLVAIGFSVRGNHNLEIRGGNFRDGSA